MIINERFSSNLIAGVDNIVKLVPGLGSVGSDGPMVIPNFDGPTAIQSVKKHMFVNLEKANSLASHARPTMLAFLSGFTSNVRSALEALAPGKALTDYNILDAQVKHDFAEWQSLTAAVALNWIYSGAGLNLSVMSVALSNATPVERCLLMEMDKDLMYYNKAVKKDANGNITGGALFYVCQNGTPFALFHPSIGIVPMHTFDSSIFRGILPWFDYDESDCHKGWNFLAEPGAVLEPYSTDLVLSRIADWATLNNIPNYPDYIASRQSNPSYKAPAILRSAASIPGAEQIDNVWPGAGINFRTTVLFCQDAAGKPSAVPEIFCNRMLISSMGEGNQMVYNTPNGSKPVCFSGGMPAGYAPVPPLTSESMDLVNRCTLTDLTFQAEMPNGSLCAVTVSATLQNGLGEVFSLRKTFGLDRLAQGRLPYLMLWPFVPVPKGIPFLQRYYATWTDQVCDFTPIKGLPIVTGIGFDFEAQGAAHDVCRHTAPAQAWTVCHSGAPFRYAKVTGKIGGETLPDLGVVIMPEYPTFNPNAFAGNPVEVAVDFGTTSTVCALNSPLLKCGTQILTYQDYGCGVTCADSRAKSSLDEDHWLGKSGPDGWSMSSKIFTVAQLFDRTKEIGPNWAVAADAIPQEYYVDSRMFLISGNALIAYTAANGGDADPLRNQHIMNDIKFDESLDPKNQYAAGVFLAGIYLHTVLFLLKQGIVPMPGVPYLELRASYPNEVTLTALRGGWMNAQSIVGQVIDPSLTSPIANMLNLNKFYTEAAATMAYQRGAFGGMIAVRPSIVSVDIGGGTTDISIINTAHGAGVRNMSLRYAGREMMVTTLVQYFRKFSTGAVMDRNGVFKGLWSSDSASIQMQNLFIQLCEEAHSASERKLLSKNNSVRMIVEMLLSGGMMLPSIQNNQLLRQIIALKFILVMRLTARVVRENVDIWVLPDDLVGGKLPLDLSISGTSAQLLQYVFNCDMKDLQQASIHSPKPTVAACVNLFTQLFENELRDKLPEGVGVDLKFYVRPNVSDKREVAFGMLEDPAFNVFAANPLGAELKAKAVVVGGLPNPADVEAKRLEAEKKMKVKLGALPDPILQKYLNGGDGSFGVKQYLFAYEQIFPVGAVGANLCLGPKINSASSLLDSFDANLGAQARFTISNSRAKYMIEDEQQPYVDELACTYLIEDMLDSAMAALQE